MITAAQARKHLRYDEKTGNLAQHKKWYVVVQLNGKRFVLGLFASKREAATAYRAAIKEHFGEFARAA